MQMDIWRDIENVNVRDRASPHAHGHAGCGTCGTWSSLLHATRTASATRPTHALIQEPRAPKVPWSQTPESPFTLLHPSIAPSPAAEPWPEPSANHLGLRASGNRPCSGHLPEDGLILAERPHQLLGVAVLLLRLPARWVEVATRHAACTRVQPVPPTPSVIADSLWPTLLWPNLLTVAISFLWPRLLGDRHEIVRGRRARAERAQQLEPGRCAVPRGRAVVTCACACACSKCSCKCSRAVPQRVQSVGVDEAGGATLRGEGWLAGARR